MAEPEIVPILKLVRVGVVRLDASPVGGVRQAVQLASELLADADRETFIVIHLDTKLRPVGAEVAAVGTLTTTLVHPREVFKGAILANAASVIVAHNHPSGDPAPSHEDLSLTEHLLRAGELLGIPVTDHLIVGATNVSLRETTRLWASTGTV